MAYGKIKADAIIYDNSGSDVEKTIASLAADTEGTAVKSTGESGTTKFLRVDGDGTCSWQVPPDTNTQLTNEAVQDLVGAMVTSNTETGITVTYEDGDGTLDFVVGTLNQNTTGTAAEATNVTAVANNSTDETVYPTFVDGATGTQGIETDTGLTYNPSTGLLTAVGLTLSGDLTVNGTTTTINSTTLSVDDKNIELGSVSSPSDATADGGGITLKGATDKEIKWINSTDNWTFNQNIEVTSGGLVLGVADSASGHINAYENMTFNIDTDNDDVNRTFKFCTGAQNGSGTVILEIDEAGYATFGGSVTDNKGPLRRIVQAYKSSAHTLVVGDAGKCIQIATGGVTVNQSIFTEGDAVTIVNHSGSDQTITQGSSFTLYNTADGSTGNRTLAGRGMATMWFANHNVAYISGAGLS